MPELTDMIDTDEQRQQVLQFVADIDILISQQVLEALIDPDLSVEQLARLTRVNALLNVLYNAAGGTRL